MYSAFYRGNLFGSSYLTIFALLVTFAIMVIVINEIYISRLFKKRMKVQFSVKRSDYPYIDKFDDILIANNFKIHGCSVYSRDGMFIGKSTRIDYQSTDAVLEITIYDNSFNREILDSIKNKKVFFILRFIIEERDQGKRVCQGVQSFTLVTIETPYMVDTEIQSF